ncbi:MAG: VOC family protein [Verrucomicrobiae bacterium]|nr:VOC family protein [Verrucomicrobiae bacterium]
MAKALGIGGIFFRSKDPETLAAWYRKWLAFPSGPEGSFSPFIPDTAPPNGLTLWSPFPGDTDYFGNTDQTFMINLMVDDLDEALRQVKEGGAEIIPEKQEYEYGRFGWFIDPEGNRVELWQPPENPVSE